MPREKEHSPISDEEAEEFARRMVQDGNLESQESGEAALHSQTEWEDFVAFRIRDGQGYEPTAAQVNMANVGRQSLLRSALRSFLRG